MSLDQMRNGFDGEGYLRLMRVRRFVLLALIIAVLSACRSQELPTPTPTPQPALVVPSDTSADAETPDQSVILVPTPTPEVRPTPIPSGTIVLWHSWALAQGDALAQILASFAQQYPSVRIETLFVADDTLLQSYADAVQTGGGPDVILAPNWWLGDLVAVNAVAPLDALVPTDALDAYVPAAVDNLRWGGQLYGLPAGANLVGLYYNRSLLGSNAVPATTDELLDLARQDGRLGIGLYATLYHLYWGLPAYGAQLLDESGRVVLDQNTGAAAYLTWLMQVSKTPGSYVSLDYGMLLDRFKKGEFAFLVDGPWSRDELRAALGENLAVTLLPAGPIGVASPWLYADGAFLNPQRPVEQQQLAMLFALHLTGSAGSQTLATIAGVLPANRQVDLSSDPLLQGFLDQAAAAEAMPMLPEMDEVWGYGGDMFVKVINEVADPVTVIAETATLINEANGKAP